MIATTDVRMTITLLTKHGGVFFSVSYRRLADMPGLGRALGDREVPFETPFEGGIVG